LLATVLQQELTKVTGIERSAQRDTRQFLLQAIDVPAACAEVGFITNPDDLAYLQSPQGQREIAWALCAGLARFLEQATRPAAAR